ncbi:hypothetical protein FS837_010760 [Tulasnella sp. UAMH 9824]|nr:hypothetical protein FS837_010760 [Tulasnella sp. UAMH 9824]
MYFIFRRKGSLNPWSSRSIDGDNEPVRVQPVRMKSIWLKDDHKYSPIQKVSSRTSPVSLFSPAKKFGRLRPSGRATPVISSERPTSKFEIDKDTVIEAGGGGRDDEESAETAPALGGRHLQQPSAGGLSNSSWHSFLRLNGSRPQVEQHEDMGSAVDFTFVSSNADNNTNDDTNDRQAGPSSRDPSPTERSPYSWWARNPSHRYPPISRKSTDLSTIYPSDSVSNLQLRENLEQIPSEGEQSPFMLGRPPQGRMTPDVRREVERARQEEEARRELAALEVMSPLDTESSIHTEKYSPPPHRSRLPQVPSSDPVMMYPGTVRGNVSHTPPVSR